MKKALIVATIAVGIFATPMAFAGTTGTEFQALFDLLNAWIGGFLGKSIAIGAFIIGAGIGAARMTAIPALIGIVIALFVSVMPTVINSIVSATII